MGIFVRVWLCTVVSLILVLAGRADAAEPVRSLITNRIDESALVTLEGNTRPEAIPANDRGAVADTMPLDHMMLLLKRPAEREAAFERLIDALHDPASPHYHHWLEPVQVGRDYGLAASDMAKIRSWLAGRGFRVNFTYSNGLIIDFSGTAGQFRTAFHTELHRLDVNGTPRMANITDPHIPAALGAAIVGIVKMNDFPPRAEHEFVPDFEHHCSNNYGICDAVAPPDLATIYNFTPQFEAGITGKGQRIAVVNISNMANLSDWTLFRKTYGLSSYTEGSLNEIHPQPRTGTTNCGNPGIDSDAKHEAALDTEWSSAAAPNAHIILATCKSTPGQSGLVTAILNLTEEPAATRPQIISLSYGQCEAFGGTAYNASYESAYQTAVALGISVFVSGGDALSADCDRAEPAETAAKYGVGVNGFASTPYNVAVGGTDFGDTYHETVGEYWRPTNSPIFGSAKSYIPEIPWNQSCASRLAVYFNNFKTSYGARGLCNSTTSEATYLQRVLGGGGGASACASGSTASFGVVSGTCAGYPTPSWQKNVPGLPDNGVRNLPDVSLFSAGGPWGHSYVVCEADSGGCTYGFSGTSFATPIMAGVQALVNQQMNATHGEGNPNVAYYQLAAAEYGSATRRAMCNSTNGNTIAKTCIFHDVTEGDIDTPCVKGSPDCFAPSGADGVLSTSKTSYKPAFPATPGWDSATGLGSVNVSNLVTAWHLVEP